MSARHLRHVAAQHGGYYMQVSTSEDDAQATLVDYVKALGLGRGLEKVKVSG
ncbi:hypothetical protein NJB14197_00030 [Mycobacterium montefiorense]|uniref:Uncharacterized protein n=1 Tax=Mycobacterium montefiorense TaxID=154654 RepID=A0AA37ULU7_9MYCO|nr:hypothetical protein MmonteBS_18330 [Mycobacterium montefiorense]GKU36592.1 hypothetical protein NJB14191_39380 [Mycobacterium montefiorense]GKU42222.1 hypothetical protein NJB14192_42050 [Mycobacterium montefiorense]GKU45851.1 hypothetical protein NJB14194_24720 [Mycobacterium montefiorense]GKU53842.1 hypothetical protein NJB14195_50830 [Mycobacterium montefiorense]